MEIGRSTLYYDENGKLDRVVFKPTMQVNLSNEDLARFAKIDGSSEQSIEQKANWALATWFQKTNEIELADRSKWYVDTKTTVCKRDENNRIIRCELIHYFKQYSNEEINKHPA